MYTHAGHVLLQVLSSAQDASIFPGPPVSKRYTKSEQTELQVIDP
jgi:hypothetical protein